MRRSEICKARYAQLAKMPADPSEAGPDGQLLEGGLSMANIGKQQAKEIMLKSLPVSDSLLRRHQEVLAPLALKLQNKRHQVCVLVCGAGAERESSAGVTGVYICFVACRLEDGRSAWTGHELWHSIMHVLWPSNPCV